MKGVKDEVKGRHIIGKMFTYVWPADKPGLRARVIVALGLLVGSKVIETGVHSSNLIIFAQHGQNLWRVQISFYFCY